MNYVVTTLAQIFFILAGNKDNHKSLDDNGRNIVTTLVQSFLDGSSSFLQVTSPTIMALMSMNLGKIPSLTSELAALERLKNQ